MKYLNDMSALFELLNDLARVNELMLVNDGKPRMVANSLLDTFVDMMDEWIGDESGVWQQVSNKLFAEDVIFG